MVNNNASDYYYVTKDWTKLYLIVGSGPAEWMNPSYPNALKYYLNIWRLDDNKRFSSFHTSGSILDTYLKTHLDKGDLIAIPRDVYKVLYGV